MCVCVCLNLQGNIKDGLDQGVEIVSFFVFAWVSQMLVHVSGAVEVKERIM